MTFPEIFVLKTDRKIMRAIILAATVTIILGGGVVGMDMENAYHPGRVVIKTTEGFQPSVGTLFPDIPFSDLKSYQSWDVKSFRTFFGNRDVAAGKSSHSLLDELYLLSFPDTVNVLDVLTRLTRHTDIIAAEPDFKLQLFDVPGDPLFSNQWYFLNDGQEFYAIERHPGYSNDSLYLKTGLVGEDVNLRPIYQNPPQDSVEVLIAIIDTGIDYDHPDLVGKIYYNPAEIAGNGIDDDHNGLIDDYRGWDFSGDTLNVFASDNDNDATDSVGHGTHVAGLVAALENEIGIAGYPAKLKILPLKIFPNAFQSVAIAAIAYAADMGCKVLNASWGFPFESGILREGFIYAESKGCLAVAAAGNFGTSARTFPAAYPETFTVGGTNSDGYMTYFSTFGPFLDIVAPGQNILSLRAAGTDLYGSSEPGLRIIDSLYIIADGTSMSAPIVAGAAGLLWSYNPGLELSRVKEILRGSADDLLDPFNQGDNLPGFDSLSGWGRLNVGEALNLAMEPSLYIKSPMENEILSGEVLIGIGSTGGYEGVADLYLGSGQTPENWQLLYHSDQTTADDSFYIWDGQLATGYFSFRLESMSGVDQVCIRLVNGNVVEITSPVEDQQLRHLVSIKGIASGLEFDSVVVSYRSDNDQDYTAIFSGSKLYFDEPITDWSVSSLDGGDYYLKAVGHFGSELMVDSIGIVVHSLMRPGFPVHLPSFAAFSPGVADIDGIDGKEIVVGSRNGLYVISAEGDILPGYPVLTNTDMRSMPAFADIDNNGLTDVIISGDSVLACFDYQGQPLPGWPQAASTGMSYFSYPIPTATQLYNQEDSTIIYMTRYGEVRAYNYNGDSYFYSLNGLFTALDPNIFDTSQFAGMWVPFVTAVDLDGEGVTEVVAIYSTSQDPSGLYIWNSRNGLPPYGWDSPLALETRITYGGLLADIDEDGYLEVIFGGLDSNRTPGIWVTRNGIEDIPGWPVFIEEMYDWIGIAPLCVDIDNNGSKEVLAGFYNYDIARIYAFNSDGTPYLDNPGMPEGVLLIVPSTISNLIVVDIDGNGMPNIISRGGYIFPNTGYERIYAWEPNGEMTPGFPIITPTPPGAVISTLFSPVFDDLDNDGRMEMILSGGANDIFVYDLEVPYNPDLMVWPKFRGDNRNSGINPRMGEPTDVDYNQSLVPNLFAIDEIYPNPFNPATTIGFSIGRAENVRLEVFNILGQRVTTLLSEKTAAGEYEIVWDGNDSRGVRAASGIYFARLSKSGQQVTRKMVLLK